MRGTLRIVLLATAAAATVTAVIISAVGCVEGVPLHAVDTNLAAGSRYITYFVLPGTSSGNSDVDRQLRTAVVTALADRGMVETSPTEAEAVVVAHTATSAIHSRDAFYKGWGGWAWQTNDAQSRDGTQRYKPGAVVVDIFDAWTKELVWHGAAFDCRRRITPLTSSARSLFGFRLICSRPLFGVTFVPSTPTNDERLCTAGSLTIALTSAC